VSGRRTSIWIRSVISVALLAGLVWWTGIDRIVEGLAEVQVGWLLASTLVGYVAIAVGNLNVFLLTRVLLPGIDWRDVTRAYLRSWAAGMLAPGKVGDLSYAHFISSDDTNLAPGLVVGIVDKIVTFAVTSAIAVTGILLLLEKGAAFLAGGAAFAAFVAAIVVLRSARARQLVRERVLGRHASRLGGFGSNLDTILLHSPRTVSVNVLLTIVRTLIQALAVTLALRAFGAHVALIDALIVHSIAALMSLIPITLSGLGVRQGTSVVLFERISGIAAAPVLNQSLTSTLIIYGTVAVLGATLGLGRRRN
jgi:uncharacterized protein (TIRG00374 family)